MARIYKNPIHYPDLDNYNQPDRQIFSVDGAIRTPAPQVNDNNYDTSSDQTTFIAQTHGATPTTNTMIDSFWVRGSGITSYSISVPTGKGSGDGITGRTIPSTVTTTDRSTRNTTINGIQYDLVSLGTNVVSNHNLRTSSVRIANDLSSITDATTLTINLQTAELTDVETDGRIVIAGENPAGTAVTQTISYADHELFEKKATTQNYLTLTSISVSGFRRGFMTITSNNSILNCTEAQVTFAGSPTIYEMMFLEELVYLHPERSFVDYNAGFNDNTFTQTNIRGETFRIKTLESRGKWSITYKALFNKYSSTDAETFMRLIDGNPNFVFAQEFERYPDRVYPATWGLSNFGNRYYTRTITSGTTIDFIIQER